jgi:hypothetical protein
MKKYEKRHHFTRGTRGTRGSGGRPGSSSSLFTIPIDGVHFAALSASPRTPREMMIGPGTGIRRWRPA